MSQEFEDMRAAVLAVLAREGITYTAQFVPQSISRHSAEKDKTLNWRITFTRPHPTNRCMSIDYSQGIGHIPAITGKSYPLEMQLRAREASETGKYQVAADLRRVKSLPVPAVADVVHCLVMESTNDHNGFEDWAHEYGYDTDSRKAEETYDACRKQTRDAENVFGRAVLTELAKILEQY